MPPAIAKNHTDLLAKLSADPAWSFWLRFYQGMWEGTFEEWDLAFEVIKIPDDDWENGYEHIARVIAGIEAEMESSDKSATLGDLSDLMPDNVTHLFDQSSQVRSSFELASSTLTERFDLFDQMARPNEVIPLFEPLRAMPASLSQVSILLASGNRDSETEAALKKEVAKLRALLAKFEVELKSAKKEIAELRKKPWYKSALAIGGVGFIGTIVGTAWMVSGDEIGPSKRADMLTQYWEFVFPPDEIPDETLRYALPETWDV